MEVIKISSEFVMKIADLEFFQGDTDTISFNFSRDDGTSIPLSGIDVLFTLCPYGKFQDESVLTKKMLIDEEDNTLCFVQLTADDTKNLDYGKYLYQPILVYSDIFEGKERIREYRRAEGTIVFRPRIKYDSSVLGYQTENMANFHFI